MAVQELEASVLDDAARAAWLYYVGGRTQDEIATLLGVSRQRAQRLVSRAVADGLVRVRIEHPITQLLELGLQLRDKYQLKQVRIAPDLGVDGNMHSVAPFAAKLIEEVLSDSEPLTIGFGTGRALRATIEQMKSLNCPQHKLVSLIGNIAPDGTATVYDAIMRIADIVHAPHYPLPTPVLAASAEERETYMGLTAIRSVFEFANNADVYFVGIGQMDFTAPILVDGFLSEEERNELLEMGAVGEITGSVYDHDGNYIESARSKRVMGVRVRAGEETRVIAIASGQRKVEPIRAALKGGLINGLVTDEPTARALLEG